ncbi:hypothetical protein COCSADRAFT_210825 [Bipolaris sorokiniana ND90Pr]|uniref:Uncharacterized protein n=1 Tax=Cochliobolus sativus (strain ND90Pr / ATCC 201652) TaxID=665912 RepID=M2TLG1_COCSN|nr:uncharacterized protein COCSADRAFT_210825 [Bipolaris sorokiniana ND90Pr]EMD69512.1 hypothetical protein COCSADRAFT_210825 [Bipolaris sorokiniana ND90Pr]
MPSLARRPPLPHPLALALALALAFAFAFAFAFALMDQQKTIVTSLICMPVCYPTVGEMHCTLHRSYCGLSMVCPEPSVAMPSSLSMRSQPPFFFSSDSIISTLAPLLVTRPGIGSRGGYAKFCNLPMAAMLGAMRAVAAAESVGGPTADLRQSNSFPPPWPLTCTH